MNIISFGNGGSTGKRNLYILINDIIDKKLNFNLIGK